MVNTANKIIPDEKAKLFSIFLFVWLTTFNLCTCNYIFYNIIENNFKKRATTQVKQNSRKELKKNEISKSIM